MTTDSMTFGQLVEAFQREMGRECYSRPATPDEGGDQDGPQLGTVLAGIWQEVQALPQTPGDDGTLGAVDCQTVKAVDGDQVKLEHDPDFVEGGNHERYNWVPDGEIWIDRNIAAHDWPRIALHEAVERRLMADMGMEYDQAHEQANAWEMNLRGQDGAKKDYAADQGNQGDESPDDYARRVGTGGGHGSLFHEDERQKEFATGPGESHLSGWRDLPKQHKPQADQGSLFKDFPSVGETRKTGQKTLFAKEGLVEKFSRAFSDAGMHGDENFDLASCQQIERFLAGEGQEVYVKDRSGHTYRYARYGAGFTIERHNG